MNSGTLIYVGVAVLIVLLCNVNAEDKRVCFVTSWAIYRPGIGKFTPDNIDFSLCSHVNYAFATVTSGRMATFDENDDKLMRQLNRLKVGHNVKTMISVGGWNFAHYKLTRLLRTRKTRSKFIVSTLRFAVRYGFDGVDMDFEYPRAHEKKEFTLLLREMRHVFIAYSKRNNRARLLLTAAVAAGKGNIDTGYEVREISKILDFVNIMTYDLHGPWEKHTGFVAPIYPSHTEHGAERQLNVHWVADYWHSQGCPKDKIVIGIPTYGHGFILADINRSKPGDKITGPSRKGPYTRAKGFLAYYEICKFYAPRGKVIWDDEQKEAYVVVGDTWIGYDTVESVRLKAQLIKDNGYGGWMVWSMAMDDFSGKFCGQGRYPLLKSINSVGSGSKFTTDSTHMSTVSHSDGEIPDKTPNGVSYVCDHLDDGFYQRSDDCQRYYRCKHHKTKNLVCKQHLIFNPSSQSCSPIKKVHKAYKDKCQLILLKKTDVTSTRPLTTTTWQDMTSTTTMPTTTIPYDGIKKDFCKSKADGFYAVKHKCQKFVRCVNHFSYWFECQDDLYFNPHALYCDYSYNLSQKALTYCKQ